MAVAQDDRVDLLAKWMGVLIRGGHARSVRQPMLSRTEQQMLRLHVLGHLLSWNSFCFSTTCRGREWAEIEAGLMGIDIDGS